MAAMPERLTLIERADRRVLGAVRLVDAATGRPVVRPLLVAADGARFLRNRSGLYVITDSPGLREHVTSFLEPPATPATGMAAIERLRIEDPLGQYLPRLARVPLPRGTDGALFEPEEVRMLPAPALSPRLDWAGWRASVRHAGSGEPVRGALLVLSWATAGGVAQRARGMSDERGEALVAVIGLPVSRPADGAGSPLTAETEVALAAFVRPDQAWPVDPDRLEAGAALPAASVTTTPADAFRLRAGRIVPVRVSLSF